jgi:large subunit ribosomal protein L21
LRAGDGPTTLTGIPEWLLCLSSRSDEAGPEAAFGRWALHCRVGAASVKRRRHFFAMYAIVKVGGKQYRVEKGDTLLVDRVPENEGAKLALQPLLFRPDGKDEAVFAADALDKVKVEAVVQGHERGPKIHGLKFKPKRGYKRRYGHRSELTRIEIGDIKLLSRKPAASKAAEPKAEAAVETKPPAAETKPKPAAKKPPAKKPAAKKPAAKPKAAAADKPAAKKPAAKKPAAKKPAAKKPAAKKEDPDGS